MMGYPELIVPHYTMTQPKWEAAKLIKMRNYDKKSGETKGRPRVTALHLGEA
jgi:hypothetical protein